MPKVFRPRLTEVEVAILRNLLEEHLKNERAHILARKRMNDQSAVYPIELQEKFYKRDRRLLRKLDRLIGTKTRVYPRYRASRKRTFKVR